MKGSSWLLATALLPGLLACHKEQPVTVDNRALGLRVTFPGPPKQLMYSEQTPLGTFLWYNLTYTPGGALNAANLHVDVGSPTPAELERLTATSLLGGFKDHLRQRLGPIRVETLPEGRGPGFHYVAQKVNGRILEGVVILRRGRIHHAQGAAATPGDPALKAFLDGFEVTP